jgi:tetratricopeptide (TPR) repeat protein
MIVRSLLRTSLAGAVLLSASWVEAQASSPPKTEDVDRTEEAKALFAAGRAAFDAGRLPDALDYFERSYAISKRPGLLYNIGIVRDRLRDDERALEAYDAYLAAVPDADNRAEVETRANAIRAALAQRKQSAAPVVVATPAEAAATVEPAQPDTLAAVESNAQPEDDSGSVFERWWFWTAVGAVVAGGVVVGVVAASGGDEEAADPLPPRGGVIVTTLGGGR